MEFTMEQAKRFISCANQAMSQNKEYLTELDSYMGDGDLGITMSKGFAEAERLSAQTEETDIGKFFVQIGLGIAKTVPSTMGTLMASAFVSGGKAATGHGSLDAELLSMFCSAFADGVQSRGRCKPGDRTVLDVLRPAADAADQAFQQGLDCAGIATAAYDAAKCASEQTKLMVPTVGKALYHMDKTAGLPDQGGVVGLYIYESLYHSFLMNADRTAVSVP